MKVTRHLSFELGIYAIIFAAGLLVRLLFLGSTPLTDSEAQWALLAADKVGMASPAYANPLFLVGTRLLFDMFDKTNFLARLIPALAGSLLVLCPLFFRRWLGALPALILSAGLALDPGLTAISRMAGSTQLAGVFILLALGAWISSWPVAAGIFTGLALLAGPMLWPGLVVLGAATLFGNRAGAFMIPTEENVDPLEPAVHEKAEPAGPYKGLRKAGIATLVTLAAAGTALFTQPGGLGAAAGSLPAYLRSWIEGGGFALGPFLIALPAYEILPLTFGLFGAGRGLLRRQPVDRMLALWFVMSAILAAANPARQPADWTWVLIPLWILAAREISRAVQLPAGEKLPTLVQFGVGLLVLAFISMSFSHLIESFQYSVDPAAAGQQNIQLVVLIGALFLLLLTSYLISWGWSAPLTLRGLTWAVGLLMAAGLITSLTRAAGLDQKDQPELWRGESRPAQLGLLKMTIDDLSRWNTGFPASLDTVLVGQDTPAVRWEFFKNQKVEYLASQPAAGSPSMIVTSDSEQPSQPAAYRGQDFLLTITTDWENMGTLDWLEWAIYRQAPQTSSKIILWARSDLFSDGKDQTASAQTP